MAETEPVLEAFRKTPAGQPDPALPFYGCKLPKKIAAVVLVSSDSRARGWDYRCPAQATSDSILEWIEAGMPKSEKFEVADEVLTFDDGDFTRSLTVQDLLEASLEPDGRFELEDGTEFYLIDENGERWFPKDRI